MEVKEEKRIHHNCGNPLIFQGLRPLWRIPFRTYAVCSFPLFSTGDDIHRSRFPKEMVYTIAFSAL